MLISANGPELIKRGMAERGGGGGEVGIGVVCTIHVQL